MPPESVTVPMSVLPSMNLIVPVGVPAPGATGDTLAWIITDWPTTTDDGLNVRAVVVESVLTTRVEAIDVDPERSRCRHRPP